MAALSCYHYCFYYSNKCLLELIGTHCQSQSRDWWSTFWAWEVLKRWSLQHRTETVMRQDKDDSSANAHSLPVLTEKKWDSSICLRNPGRPCVKHKVITLQFTAHGNKDHKEREQRHSYCKLSPTSCISLLGKTVIKQGISLNSRNSKGLIPGSHHRYSILKK